MLVTGGTVTAIGGTATNGLSTGIDSAALTVTGGKLIAKAGTGDAASAAYLQSEPNVTNIQGRANADTGALSDVYFSLPFYYMESTFSTVATYVEFGSATPTLTASPATLTFGNQTVGTTSATQNITVTGSNLTADISYNTPTGYTITKAAGWNDRTGGTLQVAFSPTAAQAYTGTITISSTGATGKTVSLSGTGTAAAVAPIITTASLSNGTVGAPYSQTLAATGTTPITWSIDSGNLPGGLTLNASTGVISGTPTATGTFNFTVKATNSAGNNTKALSIIVAADPAITGNLPLLVQPGVNDATTTLTVTAANATGYQWYKDGVAISGATNPSLTINQTGGDGEYYVVVSGNGKTVQSNTCTVQWTTNVGTVIVDVEPQPGVPPVSVPNVQALIDAALTQAEKDDIRNNNVTYTVVLSVAPAVADPTAVQKATSEGYTAAAHFDITVEKDRLIGGTSQSGYPVFVPNLSGGIDIVMGIPAEYQQAGRTFAMVRVHGGVGTMLADKDSSDSTITFASDKFSPYALVYKDPAPTPTPTPTPDPHNPTPTTGGSPQTGDSSKIDLWIIILISSIMMFFIGANAIFKTKNHKIDPN